MVWGDKTASSSFRIRGCRAAPGRGGGWSAGGLGPHGEGGGHHPPVDIVETSDRLSVQIALPGVSAESVTVSLEAGLITVSATRGFPAGDRRARVHRLEIPFGRFVRRIALPAGIAAHAIELIGRNLADGCLTLTFRKLEVA